MVDGYILNIGGNDLSYRKVGTGVVGRSSLTHRRHMKGMGWPLTVSCKPEQSAIMQCLNPAVPDSPQPDAANDLKHALHLEDMKPLYYFPEKSVCLFIEHFFHPLLFHEAQHTLSRNRRRLIMQP